MKTTMVCSISLTFNKTLDFASAEEIVQEVAPAVLRLQHVHPKAAIHADVMINEVDPSDRDLYRDVLLQISTLPSKPFATDLRKALRRLATRKGTLVQSILIMTATRKRAASPPADKG
jgi:hypothetical protein